MKKNKYIFSYRLAVATSWSVGGLRVASSVLSLCFPRIGEVRVFSSLILSYLSFHSPASFWYEHGKYEESVRGRSDSGRKEHGLESHGIGEAGVERSAGALGEVRGSASVGQCCAQLFTGLLRRSNNEQLQADAGKWHFYQLEPIRVRVDRTFQTAALLALLERYEEEKELDAPVRIYERSLRSSRDVFLKDLRVQIGQVDHSLLHDLSSWGMRQYETEGFWLYLEGSDLTLAERFYRRNRQSERGMR